MVFQGLLLCHISEFTLEMFTPSKLYKCLKETKTENSLFQASLSRETLSTCILLTFISKVSSQNVSSQLLGMEGTGR